MACLSTTATNDQFTQAWFGTAIASNNELAFTTHPSSDYGTIWQSDIISSDETKTRFSRSTESWTLTLTGDGVSWGYGTFIRN